MKIRIYKEYNESIENVDLYHLKLFLENTFHYKFKIDGKYESTRGYIDIDKTNTKTKEKNSNLKELRE